jgi:hypothetical protein
MTLWLAAVAGCAGRSHGAQDVTACSRSTGDVLCGAADDGGYVIFDSNMDLQNTGLNNYADVYMIKVRHIYIRL